MDAKNTKKSGTKTTTQGTLARNKAKAAKRTAKIAAKHEAIREAGKAAPAVETPKADDVAQAVAAVTKGDLTKGVEVPMPAKKTGKAKTPKPDRKMSGLDAAAKVLAESPEPMNAKAIVEAMKTKGYWSSNAATPHATIYAAMIVEIAKKGDLARFRKADRGLFTVTAAGKQAK